METPNQLGVQTKFRRNKIQNKTQKRRAVLGPLNLNSPNSQYDKTQPTMKRSVSIVNMVRRLSLNSFNKKAQQVFCTLTKMPKKDRHLITAEIKCFMISKHSHDSHLLDEKIVSYAIQKLKNSDRILKLYTFNYNKFVHLCETIIQKSGDTLTLIKSYEECMKQVYPPSVHMMLLYFGVFFYSINSRYEEAEKCCQKLFDVIVKFKIEQFFIIYLILRVKLKTNLSEWEDSLRLLTKLLFFSWMYNLNDLQIWCYFQFSRAYFFLQQQPQSQLFKQKSESNTVQPKRSLYRQVSTSNLIFEVQKIWQGQLDFKYDYVIQDNRLFLPKFHRYGVQDYISDQRKLKSNIKSIISDCKIRHVSNLLTRIGEIGMHSVMGATENNSNSVIGGTQLCGLVGSKSNQNSPSYSPSSANNTPNNLANQKSGNNFLLTHKSYNKNMCMFFRKRAEDSSSNNRVFYTIQNSQKNWGVLKQMLRNIFQQMSFWSPHVTFDK